MIVKGHFKTKGTRSPRDQKAIGTSFELYEAAENIKSIGDYFPTEAMRFTVFVDGYDAKKSIQNLHEAALKMDHAFVVMIENFVESKLKEYNRISYNYIVKHQFTLRSSLIAMNQAVDAIKFKEKHEYRFLTYLNEAGNDVEKKYDHILLYSEMKNVHDMYVYSVDILLNEIKQHYDTKDDQSKQEDTIIIAKSDSFSNNVVEDAIKIVKREDEISVKDRELKERQLYTTRNRDDGSNIQATGDSNKSSDVIQNQSKHEEAGGIISSSFDNDTRYITDKLAEIEKSLYECSMIFKDKWNAWMTLMDIDEYLFDTNNRISVNKLALKQFLRVNCDMRIRSNDDDKSQHKAYIEIVDCTEEMARSYKNYGFLSHISKTGNFNDLEMYNRIILFFKKKNTTAQTSGNSKVEKSPKTASIKHNILTLSKWISKHINTYNMLMYISFIVDAFILTVGFQSNLLFQAAKHYLYKYCIDIRPNFTKLAVHSLDTLRFYLSLFYRLLQKMSGLITKKWNVNASRHPYLMNMDLNLKHMLSITALSTYIASTEYDQILLMREEIQKEYNALELLDLYSNNAVISVDYFSKSINGVKELLNVLN
ncbi:Hypothetical protein CINCED_3A013599 [Cinara cedri]|nr:Hypothetical protein CINCED_3A013599 [Cinara cedri]